MTTTCPKMMSLPWSIKFDECDALSHCLIKVGLCQS